MQRDDQVTPTEPDPRRIATPGDFGIELKLAKERSGLTVRQLARNAAVPRGTVHDYLSGGHLPQPTNPDPLKRILAVCGEGAPDRLEEWLRALNRARRSPGRRSVGEAQPYRGLSSFGQEDAAWFHGREELTAVIARRVGELAAGGGGPLIVVGPSGVGKSSLLRAGVVPALQENGLKPMLLTPGVEPLRELRSAIERLGGAVPRIVVVDQFEEIFSDDVPDADRQEFIRRLCDPGVEEEGEGASFTREVVDRGLTAVLGMRADFYAQALRHSPLADAIQDNQVVVGPMDKTELRRVIVEPARQAHVDVEDGLVALALQELSPRVTGVGAHEPGALPLLSHTLRAVWERHRGAKLTLTDYLAVGGIAGSVAKTADAVFAELSDQQKETARRLFGRLVRTGDDSPDTRRRVPVTEILGGRTETEADDMQEVLDRFIGARLLTVGDDTIEISHEALLTVWPQLTAWIEADREWLRRHRALGAAAHIWRESGRVPDLLYRAGTLEVLRQAVQEGARLPELNDVEQEFFDASTRRELDQEVRERRRIRRRYRFGAAIAVLAVVAASAAVYARQQQTTARREQTQSLSRLVANESDALHGNDVSLAMQLALTAYEISPTQEALSSLLNSTGVTADTRFWPSSGRDVESIAVDGDVIAVGTDAGTVQLMASEPSGRIVPLGQPLAAAKGGILTVRLSNSGAILAAGSSNGNVYLWDAHDPSRPRFLGGLPGPGGGVTALAVSADGTKVAAGGASGPVRLWKDSGSGRFVFAAGLTGLLAKVDGAAFTPDGNTLVAGGDDHTALLWRVTDPFHAVALGSVTTPTSRIFAVAVSPDGNTLATGCSADHDTVLWNIGDPAHPVRLGTLTGPGSWVNAVAFSPDGRTVAAGSSDGQLWLYDLATRQAMAQLPHPQPVTGVGFLKDGSPVTVTVDDGIARRWWLPGPIINGAKDAVFGAMFDRSGTRLGVSPGANDDTLTVWDTSNIHHPVKMGPPLTGGTGGTGGQRYSGAGALTPDGKTFIAGDVDGTVQLWNIADPEHPVKIGPNRSAAGELIESVAVGSRGDMVATASDDGTVHLFRISSSDDLTSLATIATPGASNVYQAVFDPDERLLVAASEDHSAYVYDISQPAKPVLLAQLGGFSSAAYSATFNRTGRVLAVGSADSSVRVWDMSNPRHPAPLGGALAGPSGYIYSLEFSPRQDTLAVSGNEGGGIWLWDMSNPAKPAHTATLAGPANGVMTVSFSPRGNALAAGGLNHSVQLWNTDPAAAAAWICSIAGAPISDREWTQYVPGRAYTPPCHK